MAKLTKPEDIKNRLIRSFDRDESEGIFRQMRYVLGSTGAGYDAQGGSFPDYPETNIAPREVGKSHRMLNTLAIELARVGYADPEPEFPTLDKVEAEIRKQFYIERYQAGEWQAAVAGMIFDGMAFGNGFIELGLKTNKKTDRQYTTAQHVPRLRCLWDRHARSTADMNWICFCHYLSVEEATDLYGSEVATKYTRLLYGGNSSVPTTQAVRMFYYTDLGYGTKGDATTAIIPGDIMLDPIEVEAWECECLPMAFMEYLRVPGMKRAIGLITKGWPINESLDELEAAMLKDAKKSSGIIVVDTTQVNKKDLQHAMNGEGVGIARLDQPNGTGRPPIYHAGAVPVDQGRAETFQQMLRNFNEAVGTNELDKGNQLTQDKTLGEAKLLVQRSSATSSWLTMQTLYAHRRLVTSALEIAKWGDTDPVKLDLSAVGIKPLYEANKAGSPNDAIKNWLETPAKVVIGDDAITITDSRQEQAERMAQLLGVLPALQLGVPIGKKWYAEKLIQAMGDKDPSEAINEGMQDMAAMQAQMAAQQPPSSGQPGGVTPVQPPTVQSPFQ